MNRLQLEHLLRAAGSIAGQDRVIVIGSQSILGARPDAPISLLFPFLQTFQWVTLAPVWITNNMLFFG